MFELTADHMENTARAYMSACTAGDADAIAATLTQDALHFFPPDMYDGPWTGGRNIADKFANFVRTGGSSWAVDLMLVDLSQRTVASEWTHFKGRSGVILRGGEWFQFSEDGLIQEIRVYYSSPQDKTLPKLELGGFDYAGRGYALKPSKS